MAEVMLSDCRPKFQTQFEFYPELSSVTRLFKQPALKLCHSTVCDYGFGVTAIDISLILSGRPYFTITQSIAGVNRSKGGAKAHAAAVLINHFTD